MDNQGNNNLSISILSQTSLSFIKFLLNYDYH
jgi:hypothetical protein